MKIEKIEITCDRCGSDKGPEHAHEWREVAAAYPGCVASVADLCPTCFVALEKWLGKRFKFCRSGQVGGPA